MTPEHRLWQQVVLQAFRDATNDFNESGVSDSAVAKRQSIAWIEGGGAEFQKVCALAGFDPDFLREAFLSGRVDSDALRGAQRN